MESPDCQSYAVAPGETIHDIAMKFHIPTHRISARNRGLRRVIPPGTILQIEPPDLALTEHYPFIVVLFEPFGDLPACPGEVTLHGEQLRFTTNPPNAPSAAFELNLLGLIGADVCVHPDAMRQFHASYESPGVPALVVLTFLTNVFDPGSRCSISFSAVRSEVSALQHAVATVGLSGQRRVGFTPSAERPARAKRSLGTDSILFRICGRSSLFLTDEMIGYLRLAMPLQYRILPWKRLYGMHEDGVGFVAFYQKASESSAQLLALRTDHGGILGAFVPQGFHIERHFYGSGEVFVWSMSPEVGVYHWAQTNPSFVCVSAEDIVLGGPAPALFIAAQFARGFTESCVTYGSPQLIPQKSFKIVDAELWGMSKAFT